jgi:hypothetical protein
MKTNRIYAPEGAVGQPETVLAALPRPLTGRRIVALDNGKPGAGILLEHLGRQLATRTGAVFAGSMRKGSAATPCEEPLRVKIHEGADLVLTGTAD